MVCRCSIQLIILFIRYLSAVTGPSIPVTSPVERSDRVTHPIVGTASAARPTMNASAAKNIPYLRCDWPAVGSSKLS